MVCFIKRLLLAIFGALAAAALYGWLIVPEMISTVVSVVPFLLLSIVAFVYLRQTDSRKAASVAYLIGLFPFLLWIGAIILMFRNFPGPNDEMASVILASYLAAAAGGYLCLIWSKKSATEKRSDCN